jgi:chromosome segregation ATPase
LFIGLLQIVKTKFSHNFLTKTHANLHKLKSKAANNLTMISETVNNIEQKTKVLIAHLIQLDRERALLLEKNKDLLEQNRTLQTDLILKNSEISHLKKQVRTQGGERVEESEQKQHLKQEINQYITEIDKCIEWLQNQ